MISIAWSFALLSSSGGLLSGYESQHVRLLDSTQTVEAGSLVGQPAQGASPTLGELRTEKVRLEQEMPSMAAPVLLLIGGASIALASTLILVGPPPPGVGCAQLGCWIGEVPRSLLIAGGVLGLALMISGRVLAEVFGVRRWEATRDISRLDERIRQLESGGVHDEPLPFPPLPPVSARFLPSPGLALAAF